VIGRLFAGYSKLEIGLMNCLCLAPNFRDDQLLHRCRSRAIARALSGFGLALQIGFLHGDKHGRNSLVWDAIEPLRARINARVFAFIASQEFARSDFPASGVSTHRSAQAGDI
jgi:hypothetical protein